MTIGRPSCDLSHPQLKCGRTRPNYKVVHATRLARNTPAPPLHAADVADVLLAAAIERGATLIRLEPMAATERHRAHKAYVCRGSRVLRSAVLPAGLGAAVIARFALMAGLGVVHESTATGRCSVRADDHIVDLFITIEPGPSATAAEVWLFDDSATNVTADAPTRHLPNVLPIGHRIGSYEIIAPLGRGGMALVYRVRHKHLEQEYALKVLDRTVLQRDEGSLKRFFWEAKAAARVRHEGIVSVSDVATLRDGRPYLVMELLDGESLGDAIETAGTAFDPHRAVTLILKAAQALSAAHEAGVTHGDITPSNLFVCPRGDQEIVKLLDFGAAHLDGRTAEGSETPEGWVLGTPYYIAPEQAMGQDTDTRTDLYSLGVVLFELLAGTVPFDGDAIPDIVRQHAFSVAPPVTSPYRKLPRKLTELIAQLLLKNPTRRVQTAREMAAILKDVQHQLRKSPRRLFR